MTIESISNVLDSLEKQELENSVGGLVTPAEVYAKMLAIYLYQNDLCSAKYLWKRIPQDIKSSNPELDHIWKVGQKMWQRDFPAIYVALAHQWSAELTDIMANIKAITRERVARLVATAYNFITLEKLSELTGLTTEEASSQALNAGWHVDTVTKLVKPVKPPPSPIRVVSCEDQLSKLTDFVSFLEN